MNVDFILPIIIGGAILASSLGCVYFSLRLLGWEQKSRLSNSILIWLVWFVVECLVYILSYIFSRLFFGPIGYSASIFRLTIEIVSLLGVLFAGMLSVFLTTKFIRRRQPEADLDLFKPLVNSGSRNSSIYNAFFINLAAIIGICSSFALTQIFDDIYYNRFSDSEQKICSEQGVCFTIYD
jgi:hypothetical protein